MVTQTDAFNDLVRGVTVVVGETFPDEELHGAKMKIASKGVVKCNGGKRCADNDACVGLALFLTSPETFNPEPDSATGWRSNTTKICLTHLKDEDGASLLSDKRVKGAAPVATSTPKQASKKQKRRRALVKGSSGERAASPTLSPPIVEQVPDEEVQMTAPPVQTIALKLVNEEGVIAMQDIADSINDRDVNRMKDLILTLKDENDVLRRQLNIAQQHLIARLL